MAGCYSCGLPPVSPISEMFTGNNNVEWKTSAEREMKRWRYTAQQSKLEYSEKNCRLFITE